MFASPAYAQAAGGGLGGIGGFIPLILIFGIMYFLMIRPQQKKMKEHRAMVEALRKGDQIVTAGGLIGKVSKVKDENEVKDEDADADDDAAGDGDALSPNTAATASAPATALLRPRLARLALGLGAECEPRV